MTNREKFKAIRKQRKLSLKALGEIAGSATSISDFENGHTTLSNDVLFRLLGFMLVEINEFFEWKDFRDKDFYQLTEQLEEANHSSRFRGNHLRTKATNRSSRYHFSTH